MSNYLDKIFSGTVGGKDWEYKNSSPFAIGINWTVRPVTVYGLAVSSDDSDYLVNELDKYVNRGNASSTGTLKANYPTYTIKGPKVCAIVPSNETYHTTYTFVCYDGSTDTIRNAKYSDFEIVGDSTKNLVTAWSSAAAIGVWWEWDGASFLRSGEDNIILDLEQDAASYEETFWFNPVPVFIEGEGDYQGYLKSEDPDPTNFGGILNFSDYEPPTEGEGDVSNILGIGENLGFDTQFGPVRVFEISRNSLKIIAKNLSLGWLANNIGDAICSIKYMRIPRKEGEPGTSVLTTNGTQEIIKSGLIGDLVLEDVTGKYIPRQFVHYNMGHFSVNEKFLNFLDYTNTSLSIYLPFSGLHQLDCTTLMKGKITVECFIDCVTGSVIYYLMVEKGELKQVIYEFNGNCSMEMPLSAIDYMGKISMGLQGVMEGVSSVTFPRNVQSHHIVETGSIQNIKKSSEGAKIQTSKFYEDKITEQKQKGNVNVGGLIGGTSKILQAINSGNTVSISSIKSNAGWTGIMYPFIFFHRSIVDYPKDYAKNYGIPCEKNLKLKDLTGYTVVGEIHLDGINCLDEEKQELYGLLKSGVIL